MKMNTNNRIKTVSNIKENIESLLKSEEIFIFYGRVSSIRFDGLFFDLKDIKEKIQCMNLNVKKNKLKISIGDLVLVKGKISHSKRGNLVVISDKVTIIKKCKINIPKEYYSPKKNNYSERTLSILSSKEEGKKIVEKIELMKHIRNMLDKRNFLEVETPILSERASGAIAKPFNSYYKNNKIYLRISPELYLKRMIIMGFDRVFEFAKCFRNEGISTKHHPEFTILELYATFVNVKFMKKIVEDIIDFIIPTNNQKEWKEFNFYEFMKNTEIKNNFDLKKTALEFEIQKFENKFDLFDQIISKKIATKYKYIHIINIPIEISPLAKAKNKFYADRFESFVNGFEIANGYQEQNSPEKQEKAFLKQKNNENIDLDFINDLKLGLPPTVGLGIGIERICLLKNNTENIRDFINFPVF